jgi:hypothetical protein
VATAELFLVDGGPGDGDGMADGVITDPGGPAFRGTAPSTIPTLGSVGRVLLALALGLVGLAVLRRTTG